MCTFEIQTETIDSTNKIYLLDGATVTVTGNNTNVSFSWDTCWLGGRQTIQFSLNVDNFSFVTFYRHILAKTPPCIQTYLFINSLFLDATRSYNRILLLIAPGKMTALKITIPHQNRIIHSSFFQNEEIFVQLDELDELDRITYAWIGFNYSLAQAQKTLECNG